MSQIHNLFIEKINASYRSQTGSRQASGLSVCIDMISASLGISSMKVAIDSYRHIELSIMRFNPKNVILTAIFLCESELSKLTKSFPSTKFYVMVHSNIPFLAVQGEGMQRVVEASRLGVTLICNDERTARALSSYGSVWLPNIYKRDFYPAKPIVDKEKVSVVCAGSLRHMKNHLTQAIAAIKYADRYGKALEFYCNTSRSEGGGTVLLNLKPLFNGSKHNLRSLPWQEHSDFVKSLRAFDIGLQVSLTETFNICAADYTCAGLPMVVSSEVDWASKESFADCHDADLIVDKMIGCDKFVQSNQKNLLEYSQRALSKWKEI